MKIGGKCVHKQTESRSDIKERRKRADGTFSWKERMFKPKLNKEGVSLGGASSWGKKGKEQKTDHFPLLKWTLWFTAINRKNGGEVYFHCVHWWKKTGERGKKEKTKTHNEMVPTISSLAVWIQPKNGASHLRMMCTQRHVCRSTQPDARCEVGGEKKRRISRWMLIKCYTT